MSADNALIYVDNIRDALSKYDPANAQTYRQNAAIYKEKIRQTMAPLKAELAKLPVEKRWLVTSEGAFSYLARDNGLKERYLWPINADQQGTPQQVRKTIDTMKKEHIPTIFSSKDGAEAGAHYGGVLYVDSLSAADGPVPTYRICCALRRKPSSGHQRWDKETAMTADLCRPLGQPGQRNLSQRPHRAARCHLQRTTRLHCRAGGHQWFRKIDAV